MKKLNNKNNYKKIISLLSVFFVFTSFLFSQTELTNLNATWTNVIGGKVISKPETTSYGFVSITDGKTIFSISNNGILLWEKPLYTSKAIIKTISDDFILTITNSNKKITLLNPSGVGLWSKNTDWEIIDKPFEGRDGRFFLRGKDKVCCYGINGICKWEISTAEQSMLPVQELNDGSFEVFLKEIYEGKTKALRISPFGNIIEEIIFSGIVSKTNASKDGVLLCFTDGSAGLFSVEKNKAVNKWVLKTEDSKIAKKSENIFVSEKDLNYCFYLTQNTQGGIKAYQVNTKDGKIMNEISVPEINISEITDSALNQNGLFLQNEKTAVLYNSNGKLLWNGKLPDKKNTPYLHSVLTQNMELVLFFNDWSMNSYRTLQKVSKKTNTQNKLNYNENYKIDTSVYDTLFRFSFNNNLVNEERIMSLKSGYYAEDEIKYVSEAESAMQAYIKHLKANNTGSRVEKSIFETNTASMELFFSTLPYFGSDEFSHYIAKLLLLEKNQSLLNMILSGVQKNAYDPNGEILDALEKLASSKSKLDSSLIDNIFDAVYSVCRFMGRPAYNKSGKKILNKFLSGNSNKKALDTLKKISELDL